jgi:glyoxylase-like metal-dependent hydrolase (beta-lactamase superfamily II)
LKSRFTLLAALALAAAFCPAAASAVQPVDPASLAPYVGRELAPGIHLLAEPASFSGLASGNVTLIEQSDGVVLIDSGASIGDGRRVVAYVRSLTDKPVKAVMITHWHGDHPLGIAAIRAVWPHLRIIATPQTRAGMLGPALANVGLRREQAFETQALNNMSAQVAQAQALLNAPGTDDARRLRIAEFIHNLWTYAHDFEGTYLVPPTETFTDQLLLDDPERPVRLMFLGRANTEGDAIAWLPRQRIVMTGDVVVSPIPFGFGSYPESWLAVLARLKALNPALVVPGHGEPMADTAYLDRLSASIADIRDQVGRLARQGMSVEEVTAHVDFSAQTATFGSGPRIAATLQSLWLTPMIDNAWKEARGIPIVQGEGVLPGGRAPATSDRTRTPPRSAARAR